MRGNLVMKETSDMYSMEKEVIRGNTRQNSRRERKRETSK